LTATLGSFCIFAKFVTRTFDPTVGAAATDETPLTARTEIEISSSRKHVMLLSKRVFVFHFLHAFWMQQTGFLQTVFKRYVELCYGKERHKFISACLIPFSLGLDLGFPRARLNLNTATYGYETRANGFTLVQDVDGDRLNELILSSGKDNVFCFDIANWFNAAAGRLPYTDS
jgi:hypothetical protein